MAFARTYLVRSRAGVTAPRGAPRRGHGGPRARLALGLVLAVSASTLAARPASASGTFYVNNSSTSCSNTGPGTQAQPYCTISAALAAQNSPGTTIIVLPGIYREQVTLPASGVSGSPITLQGQGTASNPVVVTGADDFGNPSLWTPYAGSVWLAASVTWSPVQVLADSARLVVSTATPSSLPSGSFEWVSGQGLYVNVGGDNPGNHDAEVGHRTYAFFVSSKSWIVIDGFTATRGEVVSVRVTQSSQVTITHDMGSWAATYGIQADGCTSTLIGSCVATANLRSGIALSAGSSGCTLQDNESYANVTTGTSAGIYGNGAQGNLIQRNRTHDNPYNGIFLSQSANNNVLLQNRSWNNAHMGIEDIYSTGNYHVGDVSYGNGGNGFAVEGSSTGTTFYDCIAVNNAGYDLEVDPTSISGLTSNDNLFWNSGTQPVVKWNGTSYSTVSAYSAASGQDTRTLQADPKFTSPSSGDLSLQEGSPAIDSGNSGVANWPSTDALGNPRVDDPNTPNTGIGPIPYADRGALEFQPTGSLVAKLTLKPTSGFQPLAVTADASGSTDPTSTIVSYSFNFGDGTIVGPQSGATASHTYTAAGIWTATVTVKDAAGATASASAVDTVKSSAPIAKLALSPTSGTAPLPVTANASGSTDANDKIVSYTFNFGDSTIVGPQSGATASHTYTKAGTWTVTVTVTDSLGLSGTASAPDTVFAPPPPIARLTMRPAAGYASLADTADASASFGQVAKIVSYTFNFGDGTTVGPQSGATAAHTYATGYWTASVTVTDSLGSTGSTSLLVPVAPNNSGTNLAGNPSFETSLTGWASVGSATLSRVSGGFDGSYSLQMQSPATKSARFGVTDQPDWVGSTPAAGTKYRYIAWVMSPVSHGQAYLTVQESLGKKHRPAVQSTAVTLSPSWNFVSLDYTTFWGGSTLNLQILDQPAAAGEVFQADAVTIVQNPTGAALIAAAAPAPADASPAPASGEAPDSTTTLASLSLVGQAPRVAPNPMRDRAVLAFAVSRPGTASIQIFDLSGRLVRTLLDGGPASQGTNVVPFDGRADDGAPLRGGMYFYRVMTAEGSASGRFVIVR